MGWKFRVNLDNIFVTSSTELQNYLYKCIGTNEVYISSNTEILVSEYFDYNFFQNHNLAVEMYDGSTSHHNYSISSVIKNGSNATINIKDNCYTYGGAFPTNSELVFIVLDKDINSANFDIYRTTTNNSYDSDYELMFIIGIIISIAVIITVLLIISRHNRKIDNMYNVEKKSKNNSKVKRIIMYVIISILILVIIFLAFIFLLNTTADKPIIYLYPTEETEVTVKLENSENITCSYPTYKNSGWNVLAKPNGDLIDLSTGRNLYSLYYESTNVVDFKVEDEGFCIKGEDTAEFLEEKLAILGLTEREAEEFIVYWLPKLQENEYNYIRFATIDEINENMPLSFSEEPDTLIRVLMTYKGLDNPIEVEEQQLETPERTGFVAVEWGGTELK